MDSGHPPPYHHHHQQPPPSQPPPQLLSPNPSIQSPRFPFPYTDPSLSSPARKKRGRPRKYSPDGNIALGLNPNAGLSPNAGSGVGAGAIVAVEEGGGGSESGGVKKGRGRPPGSGKKQLDALGGAAGIGFTPHVILVKTGEDIVSKVKAFSQQGPRTICILSANGAVTNATICTSTLSGASVTFEGRFEIISLEGCFTLSESNGGRGRTGGMTVILAGPDGRVVGGCTQGMLIAANQVQVIVGSFIEDGKKQKTAPSSSPVPSILNFGAPVVQASPPSQGPSSDSSGENGGAGSPYDGGPGPYTNANQHQQQQQLQPPPPPLHSMPMYSHPNWGNSTMNVHQH